MKRMPAERGPNRSALKVLVNEMLSHPKMPPEAPALAKLALFAIHQLLSLLPYAAGHAHRIRDGRFAAMFPEWVFLGQSAQSMTDPAALPEGGSGRCHHATPAHARNRGSAG